MAKLGKKIKCDLHIHSQFSDGKLSIREIVDLYGAKGFGAIAITDHLCEQNNLIGKVSHHLSYSLTQENFSHYMATIKYESQRALEKYGMLVMPGYEITKNSFYNSRSAHLLVLGTTDYIDPDLSVDEILKAAKSKDALTVAAHPFYTQEMEFQTFHLWDRRRELNNLIDAWEMNVRKKVSPEVLESGLPLIANSDLHARHHFESWKTKIECDLNQDSLFQAIRSQKLDFFMDSH